MFDLDNNRYSAPRKPRRPAWVVHPRRVWRRRFRTHCSTRNYRILPRVKLLRNNKISERRDTWGYNPIKQDLPVVLVRERESVWMARGGCCHAAIPPEEHWGGGGEKETEIQSSRAKRDKWQRPSACYIRTMEALEMAAGGRIIKMRVIKLNYWLCVHRRRDKRGNKKRPRFLIGCLGSVVKVWLVAPKGSKTSSRAVVQQWQYLQQVEVSATTGLIPCTLEVIHRTTREDLWKIYEPTTTQHTTLHQDNYCMALWALANREASDDSKHIVGANPSLPTHFEEASSTI